MKRFSALFLLLITAFLSLNVTAQDNATAAPAWQVTKYDLTATLPTNPIDRVMTAKAVLSLRNVGRAAGSTVTVRINSKAEITGARVGGTAAGLRKTSDDKLGNFQRVTITLPSAVAQNGEVAVNIDYRLTVTENNGLTAVAPLGSQFLPLSLWYPTPGNPYSPRGADFAPFRLTVAAPNGETVITSGKLNNSAADQSLNTQPFFVTGVWDVVENGGTSAFIPKGAGADERKRAEELIALTNDAKTFAAGLLGALPEIPWRLVAVRRGAGFADGGTVLLDYAAFRRPKIDEATAMAIAEAVCKTWLGNAAAVRGEGYGAIREGLTRYIATQFVEKQFGRDAADVQRLRQRTSYAAVAKREDEPPIALNSPTFPTYFASVANKGAMVWRLTAREMGESQFFNVVKTQLSMAKTGSLSLSQLRAALTESGGEKIKAILDAGFDKITDTDLLIGLPQIRGAETVVALKNGGSQPVNIMVTAATEKGELLNSKISIAEKSFGETVFKTTAKVTRVEVDSEKLYPQTDYANDYAPREVTENDWSAAVAAIFNRQDYPKTEATARRLLQIQPHSDDLRTWLGRALLEQNRVDEAEKEFNAALSEKLPSAKTLAWANVELGEIALRRNQNSAAVKYFDVGIKSDAEYASNLAARQGYAKADPNPAADESLKTFFSNFDKAVLTARKAEVENYVLPGELTAFTNRIAANQPEQWTTQVLRMEKLDASRMQVEAKLSAKLFNKEVLSGTALFSLIQTPAGLKLIGADLSEVR